MNLPLSSESIAAQTPAQLHQLRLDVCFLCCALCVYMCLAASYTIVESVSQRLFPREGAGGNWEGGDRERERRSLLLFTLTSSRV